MAKLEDIVRGHGRYITDYSTQITEDDILREFRSLFLAILCTFAYVKPLVAIKYERGRKNRFGRYL